MKTIARNDLLQIMLGLRGGQTTALHHELKTLDARAKLMRELVQAWGVAHLLGDAIGECHDQPHKANAKQRSIEQLVFVAADTADAVYAEAERRGWTLAIPEMADDE